MTAYLVHVGYVLMLCALLARDVLWLRATLMAAQTVLAAYAWSIGVVPIAAWNALFVVINGAWVVRIARERRAVVLPPPLAEVHQRAFQAMSPGEFLRFWDAGRSTAVSGGRLAVQGTYPEALYFLTRGCADVVRDGRRVAGLDDGQFAGEMSLITGAPANADVVVRGAADVHRWLVADLLALREAQPAVWSRLQLVLGADLVEKVRRGDAVQR